MNSQGKMENRRMSNSALGDIHPKNKNSFCSKIIGRMKLELTYIKKFGGNVNTV